MTTKPRTDDEEFIARLIAGSRNLPSLSNEPEQVSRLAQESVRARKARERRKTTETEKP